MASREDVGNRLRIERVRLGLTQPECAELCDVSKTTQHNYESGTRVPDAMYLAAAHRAGMDVLYVLTGAHLSSAGGSVATWHGDSLDGVNAYVANEPTPDWARSDPDATDTMQSRGVLTTAGRPRDGTGALLPSNTGKPAACPLVISLPVGGSEHMDRQPQRHEYQVIPRRTRPAGASRATPSFGMPQQEQIDLAGDVVFSFDWLRRNLGDAAGPLTSMQVAGRSMEPTLVDGETIVIDEGVHDIQLDGIYVFEAHGVRRVKRIQRMMDGGLTLISDNPAYQRETLDRAEARNVNVLGMVVWPRIR